MTLKLTNTGTVAGTQVVQAYVSLPEHPELTHPRYQLRSCTKVHDIEPGKSVEVSLKLDKYAVSYWDERWNAWVVGKGVYTVHVGTSSVDLPLQASFNIGKGYEWNGL